MKTQSTPPLAAVDQPRLVRQSFPDYGVEVEATTIDGETGVWSHGQYGWYPQDKWGSREYPHAYIASWEYLPNENSAGTAAHERKTI
jgi:hypothetical protein